jgi:pimeloyl-ACP methyl ester carboxylesterase
MEITRHFVDVGSRRVHYRRAGKGPPLLLAHQSPRSSAEYESLIRQWAEHFTCIAPDTPGFGQSDPLPIDDPTIDDFADAMLGFLDAVGLGRVGGYGFHSGGIILVTALRKQPQRFSALAIGGYAIWTPQEMAAFSQSYLPPFRPSAYGEHLIWLWNRILEQTWFFPWYDVRPGARLRMAHDDPARVDTVIREMLDSGDAYRAGYGAVLRAPRDIPSADEPTPPVLITAYDGDPLQAHIDRLGELPPNWTAQKVATPAAHQAASLDFLRQHSAPAVERIAETGAEGFRRISVEGFDGMIHWRGTPGEAVALHGPGRALELLAAGGPFAIDLPGHGLSDSWAGLAPTEWDAWRQVVTAMAGDAPIRAELAPRGDPARLFPDLSPDRFGAYLIRAWSIVRARHLFDPWYEASPATAIDFDPAALKPARLAVEHRALLRATAARELAIALQSKGEG